MSLLMDALRKAEVTKRQIAEGNMAESFPTASPATRKEGNTAVPSPLPDLSQHADALDFNLDETHPPLSARRSRSSTIAAAISNPHEAAERQAVHNVFSAKHLPQSRKTLWIVLAAGGLAMIAMVGYFWWQMQSVSKGTVTRPTNLLTPAGRQPIPEVQVTQIPAKPSPTNPSATTTDIPATYTPTKVKKTTIDTQKITVSPTSRPEKSPALLSSTEAIPLRLNKSQALNSPLLDRAFDALQSGRLEEAQRDYSRLLREDPHQADALLGLASIALRKEQPDQAQAYFLKLLESDPNNASAQAGLINLRGQKDPALAESRLKMSLSSQPESGPLHFALGNLYARQQRWNEAQQAYFKAYTSDAENPDYLFNLAVSLDHLHQNKLAALHYQMALNAAATNSGTSFDPQQIRKRILELQP